MLLIGITPDWDREKGKVTVNRDYMDAVSRAGALPWGRLALALAGSKATEDCYQAADEAMSGATPVGNCLYFRTVIPEINGTIIGGHVFY